MSEDRPAISSSLERRLFIEAGWRCSIPGCGTNTNLHIEHIVEWSVVETHEYSNLLVLCPTHHAMKKNKGYEPREVNAKSLRIVKANQMELAGRYSDVERRVLEHFVRNPESQFVLLPGDFDILLMQLLDAGILRKAVTPEDGELAAGQVKMITSDIPSKSLEGAIYLRASYILTETGVEYVTALRETRDLPGS